MPLRPSRKRWSIKNDPQGLHQRLAGTYRRNRRSSVSIDLNAKLNAYRRNGVREYIVHRTYDGEIDWFILRNGQYERLSPGSDGIFRSPFFPGLWLNANAFTAGDM